MAFYASLWKEKKKKQKNLTSFYKLISQGDFLQIFYLVFSHTPASSQLIFRLKVMELKIDQYLYTVLV